MSDSVEELAELLSWTFGEFTRYSEDAHPDHNRWSWRGTGHADSIMRQIFLDQAQTILDEGYRLVKEEQGLYNAETGEVIHTEEERSTETT